MCIRDRFEHVPLQGAPQPEAGAGELLIPTIRPSGLKFALKTAVFHTGYSYPV